MDLGAGLMIGRVRDAGEARCKLGEKSMENFVARLYTSVATVCASWLSLYQFLLRDHFERT
jgi:hypothetical protein